MRVKAYAKINLSLAIGKKRPDGYHAVDSVMQSVSLCDIINIEKADSITVTSSLPELSGRGNIAYKAAELFFELSGITGGADIYIEKNIPSPAGLGGGSSDAAAVLTALNVLYGAGLTLDELERAAVSLGADVPFFIRGGTQRARGIGELLEPLPLLKNGCFLLSLNGKKPSTGEMYARLDGCPHKAPDIEASVEAVCSGELWSIGADCANSFAEVTGLYGTDEVLKESNPLTVCLSGSGPAVFALYPDTERAQRGLKLLQERDIWGAVVYPTEKAIEIE